MSEQHLKAAPAKASSDTRMGVGEFLLSYGSAAVMGVVSAVYSIRHTFYTEAKSWRSEGKRDLADIYADRIAAQAKHAATSEGKGFAHWLQGDREIQKKYTQEFANHLEQSRGIHSHGIKGMTTGTLQRWRACGTFSRTGTLLTMGGVATVTLGAVVALKNRMLLNEINDQQDEMQGKGR